MLSKRYISKGQNTWNWHPFCCSLLIGFLRRPISPFLVSKMTFHTQLAVALPRGLPRYQLRSPSTKTAAIRRAWGSSRERGFAPFPQLVSPSIDERHEMTSTLRLGFCQGARNQLPWTHFRSWLETGVYKEQPSVDVERVALLPRIVLYRQNATSRHDCSRFERFCLRC